MHWTIATVAAFAVDRFVEASRMNKRCVVRLVDYHKAKTDLLTRTGRGWELIDRARFEFQAIRYHN
jgi:hypothetical protein